MPSHWDLLGFWQELYRDYRGLYRDYKGYIGIIGDSYIRILQGSYRDDGKEPGNYDRFYAQTPGTYYYFYYLTITIIMTITITLFLLLLLQSLGAWLKEHDSQRDSRRLMRQRSTPASVCLTCLAGAVL